MVSKLRKLRRKLKQWNADVFGDLNAKSADINKHLEELDILSKFKPLSNEEIYRLRSLKCDDMQVQKQIDSLWLQKSRVNWHLEGDKNTRFFHSLASSHFRSIYISLLKVNRTMFMKSEEVKAQATSYFSGIFKEANLVPFSPDNISFLSLSIEQTTTFSSPFTEVEIFEGLMNCGSSKAPGLDGLNFFL